MDIENLRKEFADPASTYRLAPFWFLNHDLEDSELAWQINEMNRKGVRGFIMHPRHGLITPYLSDEWMDRIETCIKEADKLRMKAYLYDENNWPSGPVDGELLERYPEFQMSGCYLSQEWTIRGGRRLRAEIEPADGLIAVVAVPIGRGGRLQGLPESAVSLIGHVSWPGGSAGASRSDPTPSPAVLDWTAPSGRWQVMAFTRRILRRATFFDGYLDTLSKDAVGQFIRMTHEKYAERFEDYFGGTVDGIFTDEPSMNFNGRGALPWTPTLPSEFGWRHGYDMIGALPAVFKDAGPATPQLRCDFYDTVTELYTQAFFKQIYEWCDRRRLNFLGHVLCEGEFYDGTKHQGDFFRGARYMHFGGVDFLTEATWPDPDKSGLNNLVGPKLASSAAHIYGKPRVLSEAFGLASGWAIDLRNLKWMADWQVALGVNLFGPHAFYYSIQGHRKWECPPGEFYQSAFWPYYKVFADYTARLCAAMSGAFHVADIAVIYPVRSMWSAIDPTNTPEAQRIRTSLDKVTMALLQAGFDFDILPEEAFVEDMDPTDLEHFGSLEQYKAIIVPGCTTLLEETAHFLNMSIQDGNAVVVCGDLPERFVTGSASEWAGGFVTPDVLADQFRFEYNWRSGELARRRSSAEPDMQSAVIPGTADKEVSEIAKALWTSLVTFINPDVTVRADGDDKPYVPDIVHAHYQRGDTDFLFLVNTSRTSGCRTTVHINALGVPAIWDAMTGRIRPLDGYDFEGEGTTLRLDFEPTQAYLISLSPGDVSNAPPAVGRRPAKEKVTPLADEWEFSTLKPNVLPLSEWRYTIGGSEEGWSYGTHEYVARFDCQTDLKTARLLIDGIVNEKIWRRSSSVSFEIALNGKEIESFEAGSYLDHLISEADVTGLVKRGRNELKIVTHTQLAPAANLTEVAYIAGDFALEAERGKFKLVGEPGRIRTGSWTDQGYPFYSGIGSYKQTVKLTRPKGRIVLRMDRPADMAEVVVNGKQAAVLAWEPWEADITDLVKAGDNDIEIRVANSMVNLLHMHPKPSGLVGKVELVSRE